MSEGERPNQPQRYCSNCGAEARPDTRFCVSCGEIVEENGPQPEAAARAQTGKPEPEPETAENRINPRLAIYVIVALLLSIVAYLLLSFSVPLGFLLMGLCVAAVLVVRKHLGTQTALEQQGFEAAGRYKESAQRNYEKYKLRAEFDRYKAFFADALAGSLHFSEWWDHYAQGHQPRNPISVPSLLDEAANRSRAGYETMENWEAEFADLLATGQFSGARYALMRVREGQEQGVLERQSTFDASKSVLIPLNEAQRRVDALDGWSRFKEEFASFRLRVMKKLHSPVFNAAIKAEKLEARNQQRAEAQRVREEQEVERERAREEKERLRRFPDPHKTLEDMRWEERERIAAEKAEAERFERERRSRPPTVGDLEDMEMKRRQAELWKDFWDKQNRRYR